jgi:hypothetical protein
MQVGGIGGGEWKEGIKLAKTMGFSFPQVKICSKFSYSN